MRKRNSSRGVGGKLGDNQVYRFKVGDIVTTKHDSNIGVIRSFNGNGYNVEMVGHIGQAYYGDAPLMPYLTLPPAPYPAEVQAVLDAAVAFPFSRPCGSNSYTDFYEAVEAYKSTLTPPADIEKLKGEMEEAGKLFLDHKFDGSEFDGNNYEDAYIGARLCYETALRQAEERGKVQEKARKIAEATEELIATVSAFFSYGQKDAHDLYLCWGKLQELEGKS